MLHIFKEFEFENICNTATTYHTAVKYTIET